MLKFLAKRFFLQALPTLWVLVSLSFLLVKVAPGSPFNSEKEFSPETLAAMEAYYGLDQSTWDQYWSMMGRLVLHGDLGPSFTKPGVYVNETIAAHLPASLELGLGALACAVLVGGFLGVVAAIRPNTWTDGLPMAVALIGICVPSMVMGPLLSLWFGIELGWLPVLGWEDWTHRILPVITLGSGVAAYIARLMRGGMLEELSKDYVRTARAKGASEWRIVWGHAFRGGVQPTVSFLGPAAAGLLTGTFVVERIFNIPGMGAEIVNAALSRDQGIILGSVILYGGLMIVFNTLVDVVLAWLNPRIRLSGVGDA